MVQELNSALRSSEQQRTELSLELAQTPTDRRLIDPECLCRAGEATGARSGCEFGHFRGNLYNSFLIAGIAIPGVNPSSWCSNPPRAQNLSPA